MIKYIEIVTKVYVINAKKNSAMSADFSWEKSSKEYLKVYHELAGM